MGGVFIQCPLCGETNFDEVEMAEMVHDPDTGYVTQHCTVYTCSGCSIVVKDPERFCEQVTAYRRHLEG